MKRFRLQFRPTAVKDMVNLDKTLEYERELRRSAQRAARAELRKWRQLKHNLA